MVRKKKLTKKTPTLPARKIAIGAFVVIFLWVFSGIFKGDTPNVYAKSNPDTTAPFKVSSHLSNAQLHEKNLVMFGVTDTLRKVDILTEYSGIINHINVIEGQHIPKNTILANLDMKALDAQAEGLTARVIQEELEYHVAQSLSKSGHQSETRLAANFSELQNAKAELATVKDNIDKTAIKAPFSGIVEQINVEQGQVIKSYDTVIATIIDTAAFTVTSYVSEKNYHQLVIGAPAQITLATGHFFDGVITHISHMVDSRTRSYPFEITIHSRATSIPEGMTAEVKIPIASVMAHQVPSSAFTLDKDGTIGIKAMDEHQRVKFYAIDVTDSDDNGVWATGLPEVVRVITLGQAFVNEGDTVTTEEN